jgi:hypothetical protein
MRKTPVWALWVLALAMSALAFAQGTEPPPDYPKGTKHHAAKAHSASGDVTAVDATAKTVTVKFKGPELTFTWDDKTIISPKGKTSADVTVGSHVTVWYKTSGDTKTATKITVHAPKADAMKKP